MRQTHPGQLQHTMTATEIVRAITAGETTCEDVARTYLERIEACETEVQAWEYFDPDHVLAQAKKLDQGGVRGLLYGVPFGVKDIIDTHDMPTAYGSPIYQGHQPASDAACVALARQAGGVVMGKTVTTEFANVHPGKTRHPQDPARTPGGSSSGSAAAVAAGMVPLALGTQTTASTVRPASFCGIVGYRPTYGEVRCVGVKEAAGSLDTVGLMARSITDIALFRDVLLGITPEPVPSAPETPPKIGFCRTHVWSRLESGTAQLLEDAADCCAKAGAMVEELTLPSHFGDIAEVHRAISSFEFSRNFTYETTHHWDQISQTLRNGRLAHGRTCTFAHYREARILAETWRREMDDILAPYDIILTPGAAGEAPLGLDSTGDPSFCALWTTMHVPAITVPVFTGPNGLPIGVQLIAPRYADLRLLCMAQWVEQSLA